MHPTRHRPALRSPSISVPEIHRPWIALAFTLLALALPALLGCAAPAGARAARAPSVMIVSNDAEEAIVRSNGGGGRLITLSEGTPLGETVITVHGINAGPEAVQSIHELAYARGARLVTFLYDDRKRRLVDSSRDLARAIAEEVGRHAPSRLIIHAHSMGGRIAVAALGELAREDRLKALAVELYLLAPALDGSAAANAATFAPRSFQRLFGGVAPGVDMGNRSGFQAMLDHVALPVGVKTSIFVGDGDRIIHASAPRFRSIAGHLHAGVTLVAGADHDSIVGRVSQLPRAAE